MLTSHSDIIIYTTANKHILKYVSLLQGRYIFREKKQATYVKCTISILHSFTSLNILLQDYCLSIREQGHTHLIWLLFWQSPMPNELLPVMSAAYFCLFATPRKCGIVCLSTK